MLTRCHKHDSLFPFLNYKKIEKINQKNYICLISSKLLLDNLFKTRQTCSAFQVKEELGSSLILISVRFDAQYCLFLSNLS